MFPKMFMLELAVAQRDTLKDFEIEGLVLSTQDLETVLGLFPRLKRVHCAMVCQDVASFFRSLLNNLTEWRSDLGLASRSVYQVWTGT